MQRLISSRKTNYDPAAELTLPKFVDRAFEFLLECERRIIGCKVRFPIGSSRLVVGRLSK